MPKKEDKNETNKPAKAQNIRYIASVEKPKREVMEEKHMYMKSYYLYYKGKLLRILWNYRAKS